MPAVMVQLINFVPAAEAAPKKPSLWSRIVKAIVEARERQVEREIGRLIERGGGRITDQIERSIERHFV